MGYIAHLPKSLIGHLRSSSTLSDLAQAVEELICNSLDAGAKKICVYVNLALFYIKIEDDGSGVTRDDLLLIGERYATSKLHDMVDLESGVTTLGFRGEALSSLSDIGIVEIVTRVRGSPNTYKKIVKDSKKLSLGLYGEQRVPGTTVVLRELFYNLPVRRKVIQSSPRKVLQGVKDRTVRLALIHPGVSFTVFDLERQENVICTKSCLSSLDTLCGFFGEHLRHQLRELHYAKKCLKVDGFISRETSQFSSKALQFLYLNGRFVHKTPVHKLINTLFLHGYCGHELGNPPEAGMSSAASKHVYPMFLLNLQCPLSWYDITFEATKTSVEFKDWKSMLLFVTEALGTSWNRLTWNLDEGVENFLMKSKVMEFKKLTTRKRIAWQHVDPMYHPRCSIDIPKPKDDSCFLVGGLHNTEENHHGGKIGNDLTFDTPKRTRTPRKRRAYGSTQEEMINGDSSPCSWSLQQCSTRRKVEIDARDDDSHCILEGSDDFWCEEESLQRPWGERSGFFGLHNNLLEDVITSKRQDGVKFADFPRFGTNNPLADVDGLDSYARLRDLSFDSGQADRLAFESVAKREDEDGYSSLGFREATSAMIEFVPTPPQLRRSFSGCSPRARRRLYDLNLKSSYRDDFLCHSERQTVSNLEMRSANADKEGFWTPTRERMMIDLPAHGSYRDFQRESEEECHQDDMLFLESIDTLLECNPSSLHRSKELDIFDSLLKPSTHALNRMLSTHALNISCMLDKGGKEVDIFDALPTPSTHALNRSCILDKGDKPSQQQLLMQTTVMDLVGSPRCEKADSFSFSPISSTHPVNKEVVSTKGGKSFRQQLLKQIEVKESLEAPPSSRLCRSLSGPPFYRPPLKHAVSSGLSTLHKRAIEFQKSEIFCNKAQGFSSLGFEESSQKEKRLAKCSKGRHQDSTEAVSGFDPAFEKRPLALLDQTARSQVGSQEDAMPRFEGLQSISPANRNDSDCTRSKWRDTVCDNMAAKDGGLLHVTATQLYKDWKNPCIRTIEPNILDLSSGILGPSNKHLLPESISKEGLQRVRVLQQMDKKFIATVAEGILVVIDQHAADERVRLEQLRKEVLEEKQHLSTLLDYPQELSISLGDQQLLHTYKAHVEEWGWRFKISADKKNNDGKRLGQPHHGNSAVLLTAVPNILGESLIKDKFLSEYLHQLSTTDGTSAPPPAVLRVLASKACRGAIMFGDYLLRTECQQLVEGLKETSLSFQCAHGRPTLVPIVNLEALHLRLGRLNKKKRLADEPDRDGRDAWHGLQWHRSSLKRAMERLKQAEEM